MKLMLRTTRSSRSRTNRRAFLEHCQRILADVSNAETSVSAGGVRANGHLHHGPAGFEDAMLFTGAVP